MKKIFVLLTLSFIIFSSGCTIPFLNVEIPFLPDIFPGMEVREQRHDVISIESLQSIPSSTIRAGQSIRLRAIVKNLQKPEYEKIPVTIGLYNDCGLFGMGAQNSGVKGEFCSGSNNPAYNQSTGMVECTTVMYPQSTAVVEWKLTAKEDIVNVETQCKIGILAKYNYNTFSTGSVTFVNKAEIERLVSEGKSFSETGIATIGEGPIKPYIEILNQPIIIDTTYGVEDPGSGIMSFWIENKGYGILEISESSAPGGNLVFPQQNSPYGCKNSQLKAQVSTSKGAVTVNRICLSIENLDNRIKAIKEGNKKVIQECIAEHLENPPPQKDTYSIGFIGKSTPKYSCSITVDEPSRVKQEKTYQITAEVAYSYKFTKEIMLTIEPKIRL